MRQQLETIAAIYETLGMRVTKMLAGEDSVAAEVIIESTGQELHVWTFGENGGIVRMRDCAA